CILAISSKSGSFNPPRFAYSSDSNSDNVSDNEPFPSPLGSPAILSSTPSAWKVETTPKSKIATFSGFLGTSIVSVTSSPSASRSSPSPGDTSNVFSKLTVSSETSSADSSAPAVESLSSPPSELPHAANTKTSANVNIKYRFLNFIPLPLSK